MAINNEDHLSVGQGIALANRMKSGLDKKADADDVYTKQDVDSKLSSSYKAAGSIAFADLPAAGKANLGYVYDISDEFTTTAAFKEGAGKKYPAGTNVAIVEVPAAEEGVEPTYAYDVLAGFVDVSGFVEKETGKGLSSNDFTDDDKAKLDGINFVSDEDWDAELDKIFGAAE